MRPRAHFRRSISDFMLYTMGLRDPLELDEMVRQFINEKMWIPRKIWGHILMTISWGSRSGL